MVSTSSAQPNTLIVSNPLIFSSSTSTHLTSPNVITSIAAAHNAITQPTQSFFQFIHNQQQQQQRPLLHLQQPSLFLPTGHSQLLTTKTNGVHNGQTVFFDPNLHQQILLNKNFVDSQKAKQIIIPTPNTANLQSHHFKSSNQLPILSNPTSFITSPIQQSTIAWPPNQPIFLPSQQPLLLKTANQTSTLQANSGPVLVNQQILQANTQVTKNGKKKEYHAGIASSKSNQASSRQLISLKNEKFDLNKMTKSSDIEKHKVSNKQINSSETEKIRKSSEKTKLSKKAHNHKSTQQMNDELLLKKELFDAREKQSKNLKSKRLNGKKLEKKQRNVSIVKPRVLLTHNVAGFLIEESDDPFSDDYKLDESNCSSNGKEISSNHETNQSNCKIEENNGRIKLKKSKKPKSLNSENSSKHQQSNSNSIDGLLSDAINQNQLILIPDNSPQEILNHEPMKSEVIAQSLKANLHDWSVDDVYQFVLDTLSNKELADELKREDCNGLALSLLNMKILRNNFGLKLGPSLLLEKKIREINELNPFSSKQVPGDHLKSNIVEWSVDDVYSFMLSISKNHADEFRKQEIDGFSLTLISEDNLRKDLNVAFGPTLVIIDKINKLKESVKH